MKQSTWSSPAPSRLHVAIVMDGNGRWAVARGRPRSAGHLAGAQAVRRIVEAAVRQPSIGTLTLYAFSGDNWRRPPDEVRVLMHLFTRYFRREAARCAAHGVRVNALGRRDRLPDALRTAIDSAEARTAAGRSLHLRVAVDYSARDAILRAARRFAAEPRVADPTPADEALERRRFGDLLGLVDHAPAPPDVDLLIRTGGEQRLSDFLLWECSYAELCFSPRLWPDFGAADLEQALVAFAERDRRFGGVHGAAPGGGLRETA